MDAIRQAVVAANHYRAEDVPELRARMNLIISVPALQASAAVRYDAWERAISDFAATRIGQPAGSLYPLAVGRATLAVCRAAYDRWCAWAPTSPSIWTPPPPRCRRHPPAFSAPKSRRSPWLPWIDDVHAGLMGSLMLRVARAAPRAADGGDLGVESRDRRPASSRCLAITFARLWAGVPGASVSRRERYVRRCD